MVVGEFGTAQGENKTIVKRILEAHKVRLFPENELDKLINEIRTTAKTVSDNGE